MLRSVAGRGGLAATRYMATEAAPSGAPKPQSPTPPASSGSGLFRRVLPLALLGGTGYVLYKGRTDAEFRESVENLIPGSARVFDLLPSPLPPPAVVAQISKKEGATEKESNQTDPVTLPSNYNSVSDILLKIEESNPQVAKADGSPSASSTEKGYTDASKADMSKDSVLIDDMTPTQRAAAREKSSILHMDEAGDGPQRSLKPVKLESRNLRNDAAKQKIGQATQKAPVIPVENVTFADEKEISVPKKPVSKGKLARILGKGDFYPENVQGRDVVDDSEYQKPNFPAKAYNKPSYSPPSNEWKLLESAQPSKRSETSIKEVETSATMEEVKALRAELHSQTKWEAVRLQEAVRSQMVQDRKAAAKEIAELSKKHAEELATAREDALSKANTLISERTRELRASAEKQRDAEVTKMVKTKEEELRQSLSLELAEEKHRQIIEREKAIAEVEAQVAAMTNQFDALLVHAERAKEAAKRASHAFLLHETIGSNQPLGSQLSKASDKSELGQLINESIPKSAIQEGVCSLDVLQTDFQRVAKRGLSVAMVPEDKSGTLWGHLLGAIFSRLKIPIDSHVTPESSPKSNEDRIRFAQQQVKEGDIRGAVSTLESLDGLSGKVMADWIGAARARIAADLAADVLLADAIIAQVTSTENNTTGSVVA